MSEVVEYSRTEAALATLAERYKGLVYEVTTREGMTTAKSARAEIRGYRVDLERMRKEIKEPALRRCRVIDEEARRITAALVALEDPIDVVIKAEESRLDGIKNAAIRAEQARVEAEAQAKRDAEAKALAEARAEIERREAEILAAQKARIAAEAESLRRIEEQQLEARRRIEAEQRAARAEIEAEQKRFREEEEARIRAARQQFEEQERAARMKAEEQERTERLAAQAEQKKQWAQALAEQEAEEAKAREAKRLENELLDGREMLSAFVTQFGHREEFLLIGRIISQFLREQP